MKLYSHHKHTDTPVVLGPSYDEASSPFRKIFSMGYPFTLNFSHVSEFAVQSTYSEKKI